MSTEVQRRDAEAAEVECPRCHRISFAWEPHTFCKECQWPIRPSHVEKPHGYDVLVEIRETNATTTTNARHYKGNEATARRRARSFPGFIRVLAVVPLSEETWLRAYGEGRM